MMLPRRRSCALLSSSFVAPHHIFTRCNVEIHYPSKTFLRTFLDLHKFVSKEAIDKEKVRISDELNRSYFADISEYRKNGGKIAPANKTIIPLLEAVMFPDLEVSTSSNKCLKLPVCLGQDTSDVNQLHSPPVSLICLSFRASSQRMVESWSLPFLHAFATNGKIQIYEVSFIDSWLLSLNPMRKLFVNFMKKSNDPQRQVVCSFGDHYDIRKKLQILNLVTAYIFLVDPLGRIRWKGFGFATDEEISSLLSCTSILLDEK